MNDSLIPGTPREDLEAKKAAKTAVYKKFIYRGGAKNPGSKDIPQGSPDCLAGLVFVLTGVFKSLEREEMAEIVKNLGGKVTKLSRIFFIRKNPCVPAGIKFS